MKSRTSLLLMWATIILLLAAPYLVAQTADTGAVTGFVTNSSGAAIPNATVTLTNNGTGEVRTTTTPTDGSFNFIQLAPSDYKIVFSASGFQPLEIDSFTVNVGVTPIISRSLQAGNQTGPPIVEARAESLPTAAASGGVVSAETINSLPLATRNFTQETSQNAGTSASLPNASTMGRNDTDMASGGAPAGGNNWTMDGVAVQAWSSSGSAVEGGAYASFGTPSPDAIQELKVDTTSIDASFGRQAGAHVNLITRAGGSAWHGSAFEFFRNTALNANDYFRDLTCNNTPAVCVGEPTKLPLNQNQYGGVVGGPVKKDKLYIFLSYQGTWQKNGFTPGNGGTYVSGDNLPPLPSGPRSTVIGSAWVNALAATYCNTSPGFYPVSSYESGAGTLPIQCNGSNINPVALAMLNAKLPNGNYVMPGETNPVAGTTQSTTYAIPGYAPMEQGMFNFDYYVTPHNMLSGRYFHQDENLEGSFATGTQSSAGVPGTPITDGISYLDIMIRLTSTIGSHTVNEVRVSGQKAVANNVTYPPASFLASNIFNGITVTPAYGTAFGNPVGTVAPGCGLLSCADAYAPPPNISGFYIAGGAPGDDSYNHSPQYQFADDVSWTHGKHSLRFGYEYDKARIKIRYPGIDRGAEIFNTFQDFLMGMPGNCGAPEPFGTSGQPYGCNGGTLSNVTSTQTYSVYAGPNGTVTDWATHGHAAFIQDDWKVNKRFTVNVGLRWEYFSAFSDLGGDNANMWLSAMQLDPVPATTQINVLGQPFFPTGGTYLGWVVPSNYDAGPYGQPPTGVINTGRTTTVQNSSQPFDNFGPRLGFAYSPLNNNKLVLRAGAGYFYSKIFGGGLYTHPAQSPPFQKSLEGAGAALAFASEQELFPSFVPGTFPERWVNLTNLAGATAGTFPVYDQSSNISEYVNGVIQTPLTYTWNMSLTYEVAPAWVVQVGYQGSLGIHQFGSSELWNPAGIATAANPINGLTTNTTGNAVLRVPYLGMAPQGIIGNATNENYKFNQLQATLSHRLSHGMSFNLAYTFSRAFVQSDAYNNPLAFQYIPNSGYRPQRVVVRYSWNIPGANLKFANGVAAKVLGGWTVAGVTTIQDGTPLTFTDNRNGAVYGLNSSTVDSQTADLSGAAGVTLATSGPITSRLGGLACYPTACANAYVNKAAFISAATGLPLYPGTSLTNYGTSSPGLMLGPGQFNFDSSLTKTMMIGGLRENARLQFRAEFYNMFNHPQFGNPSTAVNSIGSLGNITASSVNPRLVQFGLKYLF